MKHDVDTRASVISTATSGLFRDKFTRIRSLAFCIFVTSVYKLSFNEFQVTGMTLRILLYAKLYRNIGGFSLNDTEFKSNIRVSVAKDGDTQVSSRVLGVVYGLEYAWFCLWQRMPGSISILHDLYAYPISVCRRWLCPGI